jgi:hypothetical protein
MKNTRSGSDRTLLGQGASQKQRPWKPGQFFLFRLCRVRARPTFRETIPACGSRALASGSASAGSMRVSTGLSLALCQDALQKLFAILFECGLQIVEIATNALRHDCSPSPSSVRILVCLLDHGGHRFDSSPGPTTTSTASSGRDRLEPEVFAILQRNDAGQRAFPPLSKLLARQGKLCAIRERRGRPRRRAPQGAQVSTWAPCLLTGTFVADARLANAVGARLGDLSPPAPTSGPAPPHFLAAPPVPRERYTDGE